MKRTILGTAAALGALALAGAARGEDCSGAVCVGDKVYDAHGQGVERGERSDDALLHAGKLFYVHRVEDGEVGLFRFDWEERMGYLLARPASEVLTTEGRSLDPRGRPGGWSVGSPVSHPDPWDHEEGGRGKYGGYLGYVVATNPESDMILVRPTRLDWPRLLYFHQDLLETPFGRPLPRIMPEDFSDLPR